MAVVYDALDNEDDRQELREIGEAMQRNRYRARFGNGKGLVKMSRLIRTKSKGRGNAKEEQKANAKVEPAPPPAAATPLG